MRSLSLAARAAAAVVAAALAACGNFSTEDLAFVEALPTREALRVAVPEKPAPPICGALGEATQWTQARDTGTGMNAGLDWILGVVDLVRSLEPTERHRDRRVWGPFADGKHPGFRIRVVVSRSTGADGVPSYHFSFETSSPAQQLDWTVLIDGDFVGASGRTGRGSVTLWFTAIRALGLNDKPDDPTFDVTIGYDRSQDPRTVSLVIPAGTGGFGLIDFDYTFASFASGDSRIDFALAVGGNRIETRAGFVSSGGRAEVTVFPANPPPASYQYTICWDANGCVTAVADFFNVSGHCPSAPCVTPADWQAICPQMPGP
jgi:hypothetical protein